jgi:hypothetical protein
LALLIVFGGSAFGAACGSSTCWFPAVPSAQSADNASTNWSFELGTDGGAPTFWTSANTYVNAFGGTTSQTADASPASLAYARIFQGGGIAALIANTSLAGAIYGATAALARNSTGASWTMEVFEGGAPALSGTPSGASLLASRTETATPAVGTPTSPTWLNFGVSSSAGATGGQPVWVRILANAGEVGADAVIGVETPGNGPGPGPGTVPEPFTMGLVGSGFLGLALYRRTRK